MKSIKKEDFIKLRKALAIAYRERDKAEVGELWQSRVMGHIRNLGPLYPKKAILSFSNALFGGSHLLHVPWYCCWVQL